MRVKIFLENILTYELAVQFSWSGQTTIGVVEATRTKGAFIDLHQIQLLVLKTVQYKSNDDVNPKSVTKAIHDFFKRARTRMERKDIRKV